MAKSTCNVGTAVTHPVAAAGAAASAFWGDPVGDFTKALLEGNAEALQTVMTFWTDYRIDKNTMDQSVQGVKNIVFSLAGLALIAAIIVGGGRLAASRRQGLVDGVSDIGETIARYLIFAFLFPGLVAGAVVASDVLSDWIMSSFGATSAEEVLGGTALNETMAGPIFMLALGGVSFAGSVMQLVALGIRTLLLPIAAGLTPLFAALSFTQIGRQGLNHLVALIIAGIAFKPVSALLYSVTFWFAGGGGGGLVEAFITAIMVGAAGFIAPSLVFALVPAVSQAGGGGAAPALAGGAAIAGGALGLAGGALGKAGGAAASSAGKAATGASTSPGGASPAGMGGGALAAAGGSSAGAGGGRAGSTRSGSGPSGGGAAPTGASGGAAGRPTTGFSAGKGGASGSAAPAGAVTAGASGGQHQAVPTQGLGQTTRSRAGAMASASRGAHGVARTGGSLARSGAQAARGMESAATRIQGILNDSVGAQGNYGMRR
ncbi:hypothetical protein EKI59_09750 [Corynebacterium sanguinis]|uniref:Uncharacterized protein n=1 Tax=Corynebacterium sanguinis TaxID=2594913 RepID=A0A6C1TX63_9CORY|nr:hypothetical protein EKI59_09750 [Corynebacterium sanguinis]